MRPFDVSSLDVLAFAFLFLFLWLVPQMLPAGVAEIHSARQRHRRLRLGVYVDALLASRRWRTAHRAPGGPHKAA
jgi:hypothetical protein